MREYGQIQSAYWTHPDVQALRAETKLIGAYLLTCQHTNGLGCFRMPLGYVSIDLSMGIETVKEGFSELSAIGFLSWCDRTEFVLIPDFLRWNPVQNPNSAKARVKEFETTPAKSGVYPALLKAVLKYSKYFDEDFLSRIRTLSDGYQDGIETVSHAIRDKENLPEPNPNPNPEQDPNTLSGKPDDTQKPEILILEKLNLLTGSNYKPVESNLKLIRGRLREGHSAPEILEVIAMQVEKWTDTKFEQYLRPATLFNAEKFNQYVGSLGAWRKEQDGDLDWLKDDEDVIDGEVVNG